jgi:hypothetical protein
MNFELRIIFGIEYIKVPLIRACPEQSEGGVKRGLL